MATKRRPIHTNSQSKLNFRPNVSENSKWETKGTKPLPEPSSVSKVMLMMLLHVCRKIMFFDTRLKVAIYLGSLFIISLLSDVIPFPKTYFARKDNIFNVYFVKVAWGWTLIMSIPFVVLTSSTYCCGKRDKVLKHLIRLLVATASWFFWVHMFSFIESITGNCRVTERKNLPQTKSGYPLSKSDCLRQLGTMWTGFDISGHAFILIYSSLVLIEEARAVIGWEGIQDLLRNEEYSRSSNVKETSNPLRNLNSTELEIVKSNYDTYTPYVRGLFIGMTLLTILWAAMLLSTMLYFHNMPEKIVSGFIAVSMWFVTYKLWYTIPSCLPQMPGEGSFKYGDSKSAKEVPLAKKSRAKYVEKGQLPTFMGMPLYGLRTELPQDKGDNMGCDNGIGLTTVT